MQRPLTQKDTIVVSAYHPNARFSYSVHELFQRNTVAAAFIDVKKVERFAAFKNSRNLGKLCDKGNINYILT